MKKPKVEPKRHKRIPERATNNQIKLFTTLLEFRDERTAKPKKRALCDKKTR